MRVASWPHVRTRNVNQLQSNWFQAVPVDIPVRWSGFLERGRPRPLNPPLIQTQPIWEFGPKGEQDLFAILDR